MFFNILISFLTVFILVCLIAFLDCKLKPFWSKEYSFPKSILVLFSILSGIYQLAFIFHLPILFTMTDLLALGICLTFWKTILSQLKGYWHAILSLPHQHGKATVSILYFFLAYLFFLSIFSVPGWDWDSMIFHLSRAFLYLNEGTIFTINYSDPRQTVWPMGGDLLFYIFTRHGDTVGVGFLSFIFYIGILATVYEAISSETNSRRAITLVFVTASIPLLIYSSTSVKGDIPPVFAFVLTWLLFKNFQKRRSKMDLLLGVLALAFGLSCKLTFVFATFFSLIAFLFLEIRNKNSWKMTGPSLSWKLIIPFSFLCILLTQTHLYIYNYLIFGHILGPTTQLIKPMGFITIFQNFFKYHLELVDFVLPLSSIGIPFIDTFLSTLYNHTIGYLTADSPWQFKYFPQEVNGSFGPFGFLFILWGIYRTVFGKSQIFPRIFSFVALSYILFFVFKFPREEQVSIVRYFAPVFISSIALLPFIYNNRLLNHHSAVRLSCLSLLVICNVINYAKPLIAYHPKAIPWYRYVFTNRDFLYREKHFFDDRIEIYRNAVLPDDRILILSKPNVWMYPYYQHASTAKVRLNNFNLLPENWLKNHLGEYTFIICEHKDCISSLDSNTKLQRIWRSSSEIPRPAAYYRKN